ncbi:MAG: chemotaxis protein CheC [Candidatus Omnitrophica bacterium]|nr:chemotaxis protein CheC [Candidatus Omnitrophota bacterium]
MGSLSMTQKALKLVATLSIDRCSTLLSKMIKKGATIELENVSHEDISGVTATIMGTEDREVVAAFVDLEGDAPFKFLFYVNVKDSLVLADMILRKEPGTTKEFDEYASSAVQELGNILASGCTNVFVKDFKIAMKPTPPVVVKDYLSTMFQEYIMNVACQQDKLLMIETVFVVMGQNIPCAMFILPIPGSEQVLVDKILKDMPEF